MGKINCQSSTIEGSLIPLKQSRIPSHKTGLVTARQFQTHPQYLPMSQIANILTRPSTLGAVAVVGSGAFYVGLKYRTIKGPPNTQNGSSTGRGQEDGQGNTYEVKPGREGGGV